MGEPTLRPGGTRSGPIDRIVGRGEPHGAWPERSNARLTVRAPNERPDAGTVSVILRLPEGLELVRFQPTPGWTRTVTMERLDQPFVGEEGTVTERVATVRAHRTGRVR